MAKKSNSRASHEYQGRKGFFGFGNPKSKIWFIGIEPGGDYNDARIKVWSKYWKPKSVVSARSFHNQLMKVAPKGEWNWFTDNGHFQSTYGNLCQIYCLAKHKSLARGNNLKQKQAGLNYQRERFDDLCFLDLFAKAHKNRHQSHNRIRSSKTKTRTLGLLDLLKIYKPKPQLIVFYGSEFRHSCFEIYECSTLKQHNYATSGKERLYAEGGRFHRDDHDIEVLFINHPLYESGTTKKRVASLIRNRL